MKSSEKRPQGAADAAHEAGLGSRASASVIAWPKRAVAARRQDTAFLPAALEIIETPPSPVGRATALTIVLFAVGALAWSILGQVDIIATAQGRIIPTGKSKVIQPFETGIVREIKVADGQTVKAGDVLVELDPTSDASDERRLIFAYKQDQLDILRLHALLDDKDDLVVPTGADAAKGDPALFAVASSQMAAQRAEVTAKLEGIAKQIAQKHAEGREIEAAIAKIAASLPLISEQRDIRKALLGNQYGSRLTYLQAEQQVVESRHQLDAERHRLEENAAALAALDRQTAQVAAEFRKTLLIDLAKAEVQANEHSQEIEKAKMRRTLRTLRAPVAGTVQQLAVHTLGGVVTPAEQLMVIVPQNAALEIEASLENKDIGFVRKGQSVEIKVETFNFTRYGLLHGTVASVSQDAIAPRETANDSRGRERREGDDAARASGQPTYVAHIVLAAKGVETEQGFAPLEPGMAIAAEIKTGRRKIIDYILSPLQRLASESLKER